MRRFALVTTVLLACSSSRSPVESDRPAPGSGEERAPAEPASAVHLRPAAPSGSRERGEPHDLTDALSRAVSDFNEGALPAAVEILTAILGGTYGGLNEQGLYVAATLLMDALARIGQPQQAEQYGALLFKHVPGAFRRLGDFSTEPADEKTMSLRDSLFLLSLVKVYHDSRIYLHNASEYPIHLRLSSASYKIAASIKTEGMTMEGATGQGPLEFASATTTDALAIEPGAGLVLHSRAVEGGGNGGITYSVTTKGDGSYEQSLKGLDRLVPDQIAILCDLGQETLPESWPRFSSGAFKYELSLLQVRATLRWGPSDWFDGALIDYRKQP